MSKMKEEETLLLENKSLKEEVLIFPNLASQDIVLRKRKTDIFQWHPQRSKRQVYHLTSKIDHTCQRESKDCSRESNLDNI